MQVGAFSLSFTTHLHFEQHTLGALSIAAEAMSDIVSFSSSCWDVLGTEKETEALTGESLRFHPRKAQKGVQARGGRPTLRRFKSRACLPPALQAFISSKGFHQCPDPFHLLFYPCPHHFLWRPELGSDTFCSALRPRPLCPLATPAVLISELSVQTHGR